ncbi:MAG: hypothetical protein QOI57_3051 [Rubrobacteraceae bacterium]|nr:hypothetical protein [Rubrobacteraceae bacterium]
MSNIEKSYLQPSTGYENSSEAIYEMDSSLWSCNRLCTKIASMAQLVEVEHLKTTTSRSIIWIFVQSPSCPLFT